MLLTSAFLLGLASTFHCVGMCGPISLALPLNRQSPFTILTGLIQYHFGRIFTYALLGLVIGSIGLTFQLVYLIQALSIVLGIFMIVLAWKRQWIHAIQFPNNRMMQAIVKQMGRLLASKSPGKLVALGSLNGLLPCGMVFVALGNALLSGSVIGTAAGMVVFGLGTFPTMLAIGYFARQINGTIRQRINRVFPVLLTVVGCMLIVRGANLGIPYLSPKIQPIAANDTAKKQPLVIECHVVHKAKQGAND